MTIILSGKTKMTQVVHTIVCLRHTAKQHMINHLLFRLSGDPVKKVLKPRRLDMTR